MKHLKLLLASALAAAAFTTATQAQTILYGVDVYETSSTGTTPSLENTIVYPVHPGNSGYAVREYWDNGMLWQRSDPVVIDSRGNATYVHPETARLLPPSSTVTYTRPEVNSAPVYEIRVR